jgi:DnaK suppressor protein
MDNDSDQERSALRQRLQSMLQIAETRVLDAVQTGPAGSNGGVVDISSLEGEWTKVHAELELAKRLRGALRRLEQGQYGLCEECASAIPAARLKAVPFATKCIRCQAAHEESETRRPTRPRWLPGPMLVFIE